MQENVVAGPDSLKAEENKSATVENPNSGPEYVASEINRIKKEADSLFGELLESKETILEGLRRDLALVAPDLALATPEDRRDCAYKTYKKTRDSISGYQEQLALLKSCNDYAELRYRKDSDRFIVLVRYVEINSQRLARLLRRNTSGSHFGRNIAKIETTSQNQKNANYCRSGRHFKMNFLRFCPVP